MIFAIPFCQSEFSRETGPTGIEPTYIQKEIYFKDLAHTIMCEICKAGWKFRQNFWCYLEAEFLLLQETSVFAFSVFQ